MNTRVNLHICNDIADNDLGPIIHREIIAGAKVVHVYLHEGHEPEHDIFDREFYKQHYMHTMAARTCGAIVRYYLPNDDAKVFLETAMLN